MNYDWLKSETGPRVIVEALKLYGTKEIVGSDHNPVILSWAKELGLEKVVLTDELPWCGLFASIAVKRAGFDPVKDPLRARNWINFGTEQKIAMLGDVLVFSRDQGGHVGFYIGEDKECYHVLGGNQGDMVKVSRIKKVRCLDVRRCAWKIAQPANVRVIKLDANGEISKNEQ